MRKKVTKRGEKRGKQKISDSAGAFIKGNEEVPTTFKGRLK